MTYAVVRSDRFAAEFAALDADRYLLDDMADGLTFVLERDPSVHPLVPGTPYRVAVSQVGQPRLRVYYRVDGETVRLESTDLVE